MLGRRGKWERFCEHLFIQNYEIKSETRLKNVFGNNREDVSEHKSQIVLTFPPGWQRGLFP